MFKRIFIILLIILFYSISFSQLIPSDSEERSRMNEYMVPFTQIQMPISSQIALTGSVDEKEYM